MAKLRNLQPYSLETRVGGRRYTTEPDAVLDVPDDVFAAYAWPAELWDVVDTKHKPKTEALATEEK